MSATKWETVQDAFQFLKQIKEIVKQQSPDLVKKAFETASPSHILLATILFAPHKVIQGKNKFVVIAKHKKTKKPKKTKKRVMITYYDDAGNALLTKIIKKKHLKTYTFSDGPAQATQYSIQKK